MPPPRRRGGRRPAPEPAAAPPDRVRRWAWAGLRQEDRDGDGLQRLAAVGRPLVCGLHRRRHRGGSRMAGGSARTCGSSERAPSAGGSTSSPRTLRLLSRRTLALALNRARGAGCSGPGRAARLAPDHGYFSGASMSLTAETLPRQWAAWSRAGTRGRVARADPARAPGVPILRTEAVRVQYLGPNRRPGPTGAGPRSGAAAGREEPV